jgi:hypothetical protein
MEVEAMSDAKLILEALWEHTATYCWPGANPLVEQLANIIERKLEERRGAEGDQRRLAEREKCRVCSIEEPHTHDGTVLTFKEPPPTTRAELIEAMAEAIREANIEHIRLLNKVVEKEIGEEDLPPWDRFLSEAAYDALAAKLPGVLP